MGREINGYTLNGKEESFTPYWAQGQVTSGKRLAKWNAEGNGFEVSEEATVETPEGQVVVTMYRKWSLSADGKTLVIELTSKSPRGTVNTKRTFTRKP